MHHITAFLRPRYAHILDSAAYSIGSPPRAELARRGLNTRYATCMPLFGKQSFHTQCDHNSNVHRLLKLNIERSLDQIMHVMCVWGSGFKSRMTLHDSFLLYSGNHICHEKLKRKRTINISHVAIYYMLSCKLSSCTLGLDLSCKKLNSWGSVLPQDNVPFLSIQGQAYLIQPFCIRSLNLDNMEHSAGMAKNAPFSGPPTVSFCVHVTEAVKLNFMVQASRQCVKRS